MALGVRLEGFFWPLVLAIPNSSERHLDLAKSWRDAGVVACCEGRWVVGLSQDQAILDRLLKTFRGRVERIKRLTELDLDDANDRGLAWLAHLYAPSSHDRLATPPEVDRRASEPDH